MPEKDADPNLELLIRSGNNAATFGITDLVASWRDSRRWQRGGEVFETWMPPNVTIQLAGVEAKAHVGSVKSDIVVNADIVRPPSEIAVGFALLNLGEKVDEGQVVLAMTTVWERFIEAIEKDAAAVYQLDSRGYEELIAGGWRALGWTVTLTPRSADGGRDIIAVRRDVCAIRILDQVKLYKPGHLVPANDVRAMWGVLDADRRATKAFVTTSSDFAPGVAAEFADRSPFKIEFRNGAEVQAWLKEASQKAR